MTSNLAFVNVVVQFFLILGVGFAAFLAKDRRFRRHCLLMRLAMAVQLASIAVVMAPSLISRIRDWHGWYWFSIELVVHHTLGVIAVLIFVYINLAFTGVVRAPRSYRPLMRVALVTWVIALAMGVHLYGFIWR
jgi:hypothetical protein